MGSDPVPERSGKVCKFSQVRNGCFHAQELVQSWDQESFWRPRLLDAVRKWDASGVSGCGDISSLFSDAALELMCDIPLDGALLTLQDSEYKTLGAKIRRLHDTKGKNAPFSVAFTALCAGSDLGSRDGKTFGVFWDGRDRFIVVDSHAHGQKGMLVANCQTKLTAGLVSGMLDFVLPLLSCRWAPLDYIAILYQGLDDEEPGLCQDGEEVIEIATSSGRADRRLGDAAPELHQDGQEDAPDAGNPVESAREPLEQPPPEHDAGNPGEAAREPLEQPPLEPGPAQCGENLLDEILGGLFPPPAGKRQGQKRKVGEDERDYIMESAIRSFVDDEDVKRLSKSSLRELKEFALGMYKSLRGKGGTDARFSRSLKKVVDDAEPAATSAQEGDAKHGVLELLALVSILLPNNSVSDPDFQGALDVAETAIGNIVDENGGVAILGSDDAVSKALMPFGHLKQFLINIDCVPKYSGRAGGCGQQLSRQPADFGFSLPIKWFEGAIKSVLGGSPDFRRFQPSPKWLRICQAYAEMLFKADIKNLRLVAGRKKSFITVEDVTRLTLITFGRWDFEAASEFLSEAAPSEKPKSEKLKSKSIDVDGVQFGSIIQKVVGEAKIRADASEKLARQWHGTLSNLAFWSCSCAKTASRVDILPVDMVSACLSEAFGYAGYGGVVDNFQKSRKALPSPS